MYNFLNKKEVFFKSILIIFLILCKSVIAQEPPAGETQIDYSSPQSINDALANGRTDIDWSEVDQSQINPENIPKIPPDKIDVTKVKDKSKLTSDQLSHIGTDGKANIDKVDASKLDPEARNEALKKLGRTDEIETETDQNPTSITTFPDGFYIDYIYFINLDDVRIIKGSGISYRNNKLKVEKAETIVVKDGFLSNVTNFTGNVIEFSVDEVKNVINKCVNVNNVKNSNFRITNKTINIAPEKGVSFNITDCGFTQSNFNSF